MSIKSDNWIRRMAREQRMIEPFEAGQVREVNGHRIVSYGTSSYGYDVRCADEFKIFTNINSTIVDPKRFDEKSFVDFRGDVCIIPPNSFALARTVEYFRALRRNSERNASGARVGRQRDTRVFQHNTAAREDLRQRRRRADVVLRVRRGVLDVLQGPRRQVPGSAGRHAAEDLIGRQARSAPRTLTLHTVR